MKVVLFVFVLFISIFIKAQNSCPVIPTPEVFKPLAGEYILKSSLKVNSQILSKRNLEQLKLYFAQDGIMIVDGQRTESDIIFNQDDHIPSGEYAIQIDDKIVIAYSTSESCYHAIVTLKQLIQYRDESKFMPRCYIQDSPKFKWRGLHLDVSRHFFSVADVKRFIDLMSLYKFNIFHWHLTDDQGWRIEILKYPKLTSIGAYRDSTIIGHYSNSPREYDTLRYGGFYTQDEIREIVKYAQQKYVEIVPEIELPGHSRAALAAYPELSCTKIENEVPGLWGIFDDIYCSKQETIDFMKDILDEVIDLFPSKYIHIGGDEAPKTRWKECQDCQKVISDNKLKDEHELQSYFIRQIDDYLTSRRKKLIGWDEILEGGLSPNATVMSWRGLEGGIEAAKQGHDVVMSPTAYCYFDYYQSSHDSEPLAIGGYLPLEKVYNFNPIPESLTTEEAKHILGGQANLWTEYIPSMKQLEYMAYPRALALIQSLWCKKKPTYDSFIHTYLTFQESFLLRNEVNFSKSVHYPKMEISRAMKGVNINFVGPSSNFKYEVKVSTELMPDYYEGTTGLGLDEKIYIGRDDIGEGRLYKFHVRPVGLNEVFFFRVKSTTMLGREVELITLPHLKYNNNGSLNLVDGIYGDLPWKGADWLGFNEEKIEMIINADKDRMCEQIRIGFLEDNGSWIYLPKDIVVLKSNDGIKWKKLSSEARVELSNDTDANGVYFQDKAAYYKISIQAMKKIPEGLDGGGNVPWTFIDEIELKYSN